VDDLLSVARWDSRFPDRSRIRAEVQAMADACKDSLLTVVPRDSIAALYLKGSSNRRWDTLVDYVPELGDVDIHVQFTEDTGASRLLDPLEAGLHMQAQLERRFRSRIADPLHLPRLQLLVVNDLQRESSYVPSPPRTVTPLLGLSPPGPVAAEDTLHAIAHHQLLEVAEYLADLGRHVSDMPGRHLWAFVRNLTWRVAPTGPRVLEVLGVPYLDAWGSNRTCIVRTLTELGQVDLAREYTAFYCAAWSGFLSGWTDEAAARSAVRSGAAVLAYGLKVAQERSGAG
jgi:hypothetical protein